MKAVFVPIRWKLIVLLGTLSIAPLLLLAWNDIKTLATLGSRLASQAGQALSDQAHENLERQVDDFARLIALERQALEMIVHLQAREAMARLRSPRRAGVEILWPHDLPEGVPLPEEELRPKKYFQQLSPRKQVPVPVTYARMGFYTAPGVVVRDVEPDAARLTEARDFLWALQSHYTDLVYWYFIALENGLHAAYPGHRGFPGNFDPRDRPWYRAQRGRGDLTWSRPQTDATTRLTMISATLPLLDSTGGFVGVTGIDVPVTRLLRAVHPATPLAPYSQVMLTVPDLPAPTPHRIEIIARHNHVDLGGDWREKTRTEAFVPDDPDVEARILADMQNGEDGFVRLRYRGEDMFCVYRRFDTHSTYLVFLVPTAAAAQPAAAAAGYALETTRRQVDALIPWIVVVALVTVTAALLGARAVTGPIHRLTDAVSAVANGRFDVRVRIESRDELAQLGDHFNQMIPQVAAHAQMKQALAVARDIQQRLLPASPPESRILDIHGICLYAEETGGDYYDYLGDSGADHREPRVIGIALGDVSGHGIGSALLMTTARAFLNASDFQAMDLAGELGKLNANLVDDVHEGRFMTLCLLVFDVDSRLVRWASAGHGPVLYYDHSAGEFIELVGHDIPLGVDRHWNFASPGQRSFAPGDIFVLATDGVAEAQAVDGARFGKARLQECVDRHRAGDAAGIADAIVTTVARFSGRELPRDDLTVVVVKVKPAPAGTGDPAEAAFPAP